MELISLQMKSCNWCRMNELGQDSINRIRRVDAVWTRVRRGQHFLKAWKLCEWLNYLKQLNCWAEQVINGLAGNIVSCKGVANLGNPLSAVVDNRLKVGTRRRASLKADGRPAPAGTLLKEGTSSEW